MQSEHRDLKQNIKTQSTANNMYRRIRYIRICTIYYITKHRILSIYRLQSRYYIVRYFRQNVQNKSAAIVDLFQRYLDGLYLLILDFLTHKIPSSIHFILVLRLWCDTRAT